MNHHDDVRAGFQREAILVPFTAPFPSGGFLRR